MEPLSRAGKLFGGEAADAVLMQDRSVEYLKMDKKGPAYNLLKIIEANGLAKESGKALYSGIATLAPGRIYLLGWNPGGDPDKEDGSVEDHFHRLANEQPDWNEYLDATWTSHGRPCAPGEAPMQKRVCNLLDGIGLSVRTVCASNVIFARSRTTQHLKTPWDLAARCWPVHEFIIGLVKPVGILAIGTHVFDYVTTQGRASSHIQTMSALQGRLMCRAVSLRLCDLDLALVSTPHLGERLHYDPERHPAAIQWVGDKLGLRQSGASHGAS